MKVVPSEKPKLVREAVDEMEGEFRIKDIKKELEKKGKEIHRNRVNTHLKFWEKMGVLDYEWVNRRGKNWWKTDAWDGD